MLKRNELQSLLKASSLAILMAALSVSCTKKRPAAWPDGEAETVFDIKEVEAGNSEIVLSSEQEAMTASFGELQAVGEGAKLKVEAVQTDDRLKPLFSELFVTGASGQTQKIRFLIGSKFVTAVRVLNSNEMQNLPVMEQALIVEKGDQAVLPIFQTPILEMGTVERSKNENGEETKTLKLKASNRAAATHVKFSTLIKDRANFGVSAAQLKEAKEIFIAEKLNGKVMSSDELQEQLNIKLGRSGRYLVKIDKINGKSLVRLFAVLKFSDLSDAKKALILAQDRGQKPINTQRCDEALSAANGKDCIVDLAYDVDGVELVRSTLSPIDAEGNLSTELSFEKPKGGLRADLIKIPAQPGLKDYLVSESDFLSQINPASILQKKLFEGQEFLMRRTMQDSPNSFDFTFAGSSGPLEIVKFEFEKGRVRVIRADAVLRADGSTAVDKETLMVLPATYKKVVKTDAEGNTTELAELVDANHTEADAIAIVDWTSNSIPTVSSPLDFYELEQCFSGVGERVVSEVDQRLEQDGMLNFTLISTYAGNRGSFDCAGISEAGYFDTVQKNFTFKERISFKKHVVAAGQVEAPELNMPLEAQKKLGFGLFTYIRKKATQNNVPGVEGTEDYVPSLFDIKNGKKITYILAGLPQGSDARSTAIRTQITASTQKVIRDLNIAFRKALKGTAQERNDDVLELVIESEAKTKGVLGDLDRNYIYYVDKATSSGIIGLGGSHANPRSGVVESASVYLYGGNMLSMVESLRKLDAAKKEYEAGMAGQFLTQGGDEGGGGASGSGGGSGTESGVEEQVIPGANAKTGLGKVNAKIHGLGRDLRKSAFVNSQMRASVVAKLPKFNEKTEKSLQALEKVLSKKELLDASKIARIIKETQDHGHKHDENELASPLSRMEKSGLCVMQKDLAGMMAGEGAAGYDITKKSDIEVLADIWAPTLAHEIGHNLGLRHNFIGSYDLANHKFHKDEESIRDYSSVMDYLNDDHFTYDGLGPHDVMALRAAYAQVLELNDGRLIKLDDVKKALGLSSWTELSSDVLAQTPIKKFLFCSDEEAGELPTCNRFDSGTTPEKIVDFHIKAYRQNYALTNFPNDKLVFGPQNTSNYIGRLFSRFFAIRQMMEETILMASQGASFEQYRPYLIGAFKGLYFLNQVVRTPELPRSVENRLERFVQIEQEDGSKAIVEAKYLNDVALDSTGTRLKARGIEFDKVIAMIALSTRENSSMRYALSDIQFSLGDLGGADTPLATQGLFKETLSNNLMPIAQGKDELESLEKEDDKIVRFVPIPGQFRASVTDLMRVYSVIGSTLNLDAPSPSNPAANFRMLSKLDVAAGVPFVQMRESPNDLKYVANPESKHSRSMVEKGFVLQLALDKKQELTPSLIKWMVLSLKKDKTPEETAELATLVESINKVLGSLPEAAGTKDIAKLAGLVAAVNNVGTQIAPLRPAPGQSNPAFDRIKDSIVMQIEVMARQDAVLALLSEALGDFAGSEEGDAALKAALANVSDLLATGVLSGDQFAILRNAQLLNRFLIEVHPEYAR